MPEKTRPYDPERDGASPALIKRYQSRIAELEELLGLQRLVADHFQKRVTELEARLARQAPSTPEPEKSYAPWAVDHKGADFFDLSRVGFESLKGEIYADDNAEWVIGLRDWLNDKYPIQNTLAEQEAGECDPCNIHPHNGLCINCGSAGRGR
jgi:hypothetical protein